MVITESENQLSSRLLSLEGLGPVLSLTQRILTDGTLRTDFLARPECRTFVLDTGEGDARDANLFGSANIESWLHLHLSNKVSDVMKLHVCYQNMLASRSVSKYFSG